MNSNYYWPVYKNIESEFNNLMFNIHIDDKQLDVYSSKISDLILRASTEIESLSKELYKINGGEKSENIKYDEDAITFLNNLWKLHTKKVIISSYNCFTTNKELSPFVKNEKRTGSTRLTYSWNNSYQNLKHDRANSFTFGSIKYLFDVTSALYLLNIYFKDESFDLKDNAKGSNFDFSLGSSIFSIKPHINSENSLENDFQKNVDFDECVYLVKPTDTTREQVQDVFKKVNLEIEDSIRCYVLEQISKQQIDNMQLPDKINELVAKIKPEMMVKVGKENAYLMTNAFKNLRYEGVLNKNQF